MKSKVLVSSILTIALCLSLIAGSTFALFTDQTKYGIEVTSGDVEIYAYAGINAVYSAKGPVAEHDDPFLKDEDDNYYEHVDPKTVVAGIADNTFINGGEAVLNGSNLALNRVTPGDRVDVDINVTNKSDVAIAYRYMLIAEETNLAKGMVVTIDGEAYPALKSWTSDWFVAKADGGTPEAIPVRTISIELPVYAGNEYQSEKEGNQYYDEDGNEHFYTKDVEQKVNYTILVEAVQSNAVLQSIDVVEYLDGANVNYGGLELGTGVVLGEGKTLNLSNVTLTTSTANQTNQDTMAAVFQNNGGTAVLTNAVIDGGDGSDYGVISKGGSTTVLNNVDVKSQGGAIGVTGGAQVEFNSGAVEMDIPQGNTSPRYVIYVDGEGSTVTINDGEFKLADDELTLKRAYVYAGAGTTVYINGGTFGKPSNRKGYSTGITGTGTVIITGGTFGFDPSAWVADGFKAVKAGSTWSVVPVEVADVKDALANGENVVLGSDLSVDNTADYVTNGSGKTALAVNGNTFDGNGNAVYAPNSNATWDSAISTNGGTIKNLTVASGFRGIFITKGTNPGKVYLDNVVIDGPTYTISCDSGSGNGLEATNSTFNGWTSYAASIGDVKFVDCSFGKGAGYAFCRPYAPTEFVGCDFAEGYKIDARAAITFENCTINGEPLTVENLATLVTRNISNATVK